MIRKPTELPAACILWGQHVPWITVNISRNSCNNLICTKYIRDTNLSVPVVHEMIPDDGNENPPAIGM